MDHPQEDYDAYELALAQIKALAEKKEDGFLVASFVRGENGLTNARLNGRFGPCEVVMTLSMIYQHFPQQWAFFLENIEECGKDYGKIF